MIELMTSIIQLLTGDITMNEIIMVLFNICCRIIYLIGDITGMGYELTNLVIFVIVNPLLTLIFFYLWRKSQTKNKVWKEFSKMSCLNQTSAI